MIATKKKRKDGEHELQATYFSALAMLSRWEPRLDNIYAIPNGGHRHIAVAAKLRREGVKSGIPDICVPYPSANNLYCGLYIEMKFEKGKPSENQVDRMEMLKEAGHDVHVTNSAKVALELTLTHLGRRDLIGNTKLQLLNLK